MISFKKLTLFSGYLSLALLFGVSAFLFIGFMQKETIKTVNVSFEVKEKALGVDLWRFSKIRKYHIISQEMVKLKNGVLKLIKPKLWVFEPAKPDVFLISNEAVIYPNNDIYAYGDVRLKREDLNIYGDEAKYSSEEKTIESSKPFRGSNKKSNFKGKSFVYYLDSSKLIARGVDIWLGKNR
ncbi:LPS export ABC transporter periplasmic protein LptC [Hippea maritima]|uniref:LPS export ABC transporter periplasmic protein LptC n=1 Tax=Hippea maritima (strain ATCC 700847 / DSM 10411 / MH2) TaxID=760142 RepID=F2LUG9_HIPMA|nr:LPS export ABC transporter periplasmic protein LptC [Hippea maritima]AEA33495.1 protein of unknown function DUF1239 [Hippea maritima DSM 10411]